MVFSETVGIATIRVQNIVAHVGIATTLSKVARDVDRMSSALDPNKSDSVCREAMLHCASLDQKLSWALKVIFLEYSVRLMTEVPMSVHELSCQIESYNAFNALCRLYSFLLVISAGERFYQSMSRLRRRVRRILTRKQNELQLFLRLDHGVHITSSTIMNWKSFIAFLGFASSFSFTVFQYSVGRHSACADAYRSDYC